MMAKRILGTAAGIVVAVVLVGIIEGLGHLVFPPPAGIDVSDPDTLAQIMHIMPMGAKIAVLVAWFAGAFIGGCAALFITRWNMSAWIVALFMLAGSVFSLVTIPHPIWMAVAGVLIPFIGAFLAIRLVPKKNQ